MKTKWKLLLPVGLTVFALVCIFGGQALVKHSEEQRLAELKAQNSMTPEVPPSDAPENVVYPSSCRKLHPTPGCHGQLCPV